MEPAGPARRDPSLLPLFPLGQVLLPGCGLPLRIFEPRYRRMLVDLAEPNTRRAFGVVALVAGLEVDTGLDDKDPMFERVGTIAEILEIEQEPDGTIALLAAGSERFRVLRVVETTAPYMEAQVEILDEPVGRLPDSLPSAARALGSEYQRLLAELAPVTPVPEPYPVDAVALSYRLAAEAPLSNEDRQRLLCSPDAGERLREIRRVLRRELVLLRETRSIAVAPSILLAALRPN